MIWIFQLMDGLEFKCLAWLKKVLVINDAIIQTDTEGKGSIWADFIFFLITNPEWTIFSYFIKQTSEFSDLITAGTICPEISDVEYLTLEDHTTNMDKTIPS